MRRVTAYNIISIIALFGMLMKLAAFQIAYLSPCEIAYDIHSVSTFLLALSSFLIIPFRKGRIVFSRFLKIVYANYLAAESFNMIKELNGMNEISPLWHHFAFWSLIIFTTITTYNVLKYRNES